MTVNIPFDNSFAALPNLFYAQVSPTPVNAPKLIAWNERLADLLGVQGGDSAERAAIFGGNQLLDGSAPLAQIYAGHQFGTFNPQLGDGRAVLLGETLGRDGRRYDIQLKGSGPTPFSRRGDGRAWLGPVLREYVVSEAMAALDVPTTRALAVVSTGETVWRESGLPGAVLTRVAASHLRVGTFQIFAARGQQEALRQLTDYAIARHYPDAQGPLGLLRAVRDAQVALIASWMSYGFIHGVMNTDNMAISGETIDYGPCAFMDVYHPNRVFSSIDRHGRYAYSSQPSIAVWNLAQLATALIQQVEHPEELVDEATEIVHATPDLLETAWLQCFGAKIGVAEAAREDRGLVEDLLALMAKGQADFTNTFRALSAGGARDQFLDPAGFDLWETRWSARLERETNPEAVMKSANPILIPRNHRIEEMIAAAVEGDFEPFQRLMAALSRPYDADPQYIDLRRPPAESEVVQATFCGT